MCNYALYNANSYSKSSITTRYDFCYWNFVTVIKMKKNSVLHIVANLLKILKYDSFYSEYFFCWIIKEIEGYLKYIIIIWNLNIQKNVIIDKDTTWKCETCLLLIFS